MAARKMPTAISSPSPYPFLLGPLGLPLHRLSPEP
jgi:hypothetical protein